MSTPTLADFINVLKSHSATRIFKIEIVDLLDNVLTLLDSSKIVDGSLSKSGGMGSRRGGTIAFDNANGEFTPSPTGIIWGRRRVKLSTGVIVNGEDYYVSHGIFVMGDVKINDDKSSEVEVELIDKFGLLDGTFGGTLSNLTTIAVGTSISDVVVALLTEAGDNKTPLIYPTTATLPYSLEKSAGDTVGDALTEIANMLSWWCYYDEDGYFRFEPQVNLESSPSAWTFNADDLDEVIAMTSGIEYNFTNLANNIVVIGDTVKGDTYRSEAQDTSTGKGTGVSEIGIISKVIDDSLIYSQTLADQRALAELSIGVSIIKNIDLTTMHVDLLEGGTIITVVNDNLGISTSERFIVDSISFPLKVDGNMSISARQERTL